MADTAAAAISTGNGDGENAPAQVVQPSDSQLAAALINTKALPPNLRRMKELADEAKAYHACAPYPYYAFRNWKTEDRGPLPACMPVAKRIVKRGAKWLAGKPIAITCSANEDLENEIRDAWEANKMDSRLRAMAEKAGTEAGVVLKFAYDEAAPDGQPKLTIQSLSAVEECRLFPHPHKRDVLLMARIQYLYQDPADGQCYWYREEWTAEEEVHYEPVKDATGGTGMNRKFDPDAYEGWTITTREANPLSVIPLTYIKNLETDDFWGGADLWSLEEGDGLYRILDRINITRYLQDRSNQYDSTITAWLIDADVDDDDINKPVQPGQPVAIETTENAQAAGNQAKVQTPTGGNALRPAMAEYCKDLAREIESAASSVDVDQRDFSNKGNLTRAVLEQLYMPQIEITDEKRKSWSDGLKAFWALVARGVSKLGVPLGVTEDAASYAIEIHWPDYFPLSEDEKTAIVGRTQEEEFAGYLTRERAIERIAHVEEIADVDALKDELKKTTAPADATVATVPGAAPGVADADKEVAGLQSTAGAGAR